MRYDIIADTHGYLSESLLNELEGCDMIVHAGDMCSGSDFRRLQKIAPVKMCLGNNDWGYEYEYGPDVKPKISFVSSGLTWQICHYYERLDPKTADICVCGHSHRPLLETVGLNTLIINPGSPTYPRGRTGPSMGRIIVEDGTIVSATTFEIKRR